jgi:pyridoxal/pyridoxine/pyridoxamine kinase
MTSRSNTIPIASMSAPSQKAACFTIAAIREAGFDVVPDPTTRFPNHAHLIHPQGVAGFADEYLVTLVATFHDTVGC